MKKLISIILIIVMITAMTIPASADEEEPVPEVEEDVFELAQTAVEEADEDGAEYEGFIFKLEPSDEIDVEELDGIEAIDENEGLYTAESIEVIEDVVPQEIIEYIEPDYLMELFSASDPNDEYYGTDQWNIADMNVTPLWQVGVEGQDFDSSVDMDHDGNTGNDKIIVAVLDSGLNLGHEDIDASRITGSRNTIEGSSDVTDEVGHGTFVAGQIMAVKDNALGIAGLGQKIYVMPVKVFKGSSTQTSYVVSALKYIVSQKRTFITTNGASGTDVSVINISFGGSKSTEALKEAIESAIDLGIIVVCAAGNSGDSGPIYPAMYAIGVGAYGSSGNVSSFSQRLSSANGEGYENKVWVSAPGEGITSTYAMGNSSYEKKSGTSYACPEVATLAAICKGIDNSLNHYSFRQLLKNTAVYKNSGLGNENGQDIGFGWGVVDYAATVRALGFDLTLYPDGWFKGSGGKWYYYTDHIAATGWKKISGKWYYFNARGQMLTGWQLVDGKWYYLQGSGEMTKGWLKYGDKWYFLRDTGVMATGWEKVNGNWYYFISSGAMTTGWQYVEGKWYYLDSSGAMQKGWLKTGNTWYYLKSSGAMATGWEKVNGSWYYFRNSGAMATGWVKDNGKWYYLQSSGEMLTGWQTINGKQYFLKSSGAMAENEWVSGYWWLSAGGAWTYQYRGSWHHDSRGWWFGDTTGWYAKNETVIINGTAYTFDQAGYWIE